MKDSEERCPSFVTASSIFCSVDCSLGSFSRSPVFKMFYTCTIIE